MYLKLNNGMNLDYEPLLKCWYIADIFYIGDAGVNFDNISIWIWYEQLLVVV